jgi:hypothetical protein
MKEAQPVVSDQGSASAIMDYPPGQQKVGEPQFKATA